MTDPGYSEEVSILLSTLLDREFSTSQGVVDIRRKACLIKDYVESDRHRDVVYTGSRAEGMALLGSDIDVMYVDKNVVVMYPGQCIPPEHTDKTVLYMREADRCQPGYVTLQLGHLGKMGATTMLVNSLVPVPGKGVFLSSDMCREEYVKFESYDDVQDVYKSNGPSCTRSKGAYSWDSVYCFPCNSWPREANEWITRPRLFEWPSRSVIDISLHDGCHLVPVGDKCSEDTLLQWRISFAKTERRLVHSFSQIQFKVYVLLKIMLKQMKDVLENIVGDTDILCSYFMKITMFFAIENSNAKFWQEKNLLYCFWFCFNILITWVNVGYCPNYLIPANNMFRRKIHGEQQQKLLHIFNELHQENWMCLSIGNQYRPIMLDLLSDQAHQELMNPQNTREIEYEQDINTAGGLYDIKSQQTCNTMLKLLCLLLKSQTEIDEVFVYYSTIKRLSTLAMDKYPDHTVPADNKTRYNTLRQCKLFLIPRSSIGTELLYLATFYFLIGNYRKSLAMCRHVMSREPFWVDLRGQVPPETKKKYMHYYCGKGHTLIHKVKETFTEDLSFDSGNVCVPHLHMELAQHKSTILKIPPLPYGVFLSFLCCHELGDTSGRDTALRNMTMVKYDEQQGGHNHWIVHTLLGICYQTLGDKRMAIRAYWDSHRTKTNLHECNPAMERIEALERSDTT